YAIDSASGPKSGELTVPATAGPVTASLQSAKYNVGAVGGTASAAVSVLTGALHTSVVDLNAGLGDHGVNSGAGASQSGAAPPAPPSGRRSRPCRRTGPRSRRRRHRSPAARPTRSAPPPSCPRSWPR